MGDEAEVVAVDAHAEGVGGDDDRDLLGHEAFLRGGAGGVAHAGMVHCGPDLARLEQLVHLLDVAACGAVDDAGLEAGGEIGDALEFVVVRGGLGDAQAEVGAGEAVHEDGGFAAAGLAEAEVGDDVGAHLRGGGGGHGHHADAGQAVDGEAEAHVVGPEIVAPLADAVGLVDGEQIDRQCAEVAPEAFVAEAFGRDVDEFVFAGAQVAQAGHELGAFEGAVEGGGGDALFAEAVDLVLHQRDERRDHDGDAGEDHGRELVAQRFAGARGHDDHGVAPAGDRSDDLLLAFAEGVEAEVLFQGLLERPGRVVGDGGHGSVLRERAGKINA